MAQRRMFSADIVASDAFLDMPTSTRELYFQLGMYADDDGFINPKKIVRMIGASDDDMKVLLAKRFLLPFESGVVVIKHWLIHNLIRADLYKETTYREEKSSLGVRDNGAYTELRDGVSPLKKIEAPNWLKQRRGEQRHANGTQTAPRLGKDRVGKVRLGKDSEEEKSIVAIAPTKTPGEIARAFFDSENPKHQEYWETTLGWLLEKGIPLALAEKELRKFGNYWSEKNKSGKKMLWETKPTFELNRRLATWFGNLEKRFGSIDNSRVGKNYDKE